MKKNKKYIQRSYRAPHEDLVLLRKLARKLRVSQSEVIRTGIQLQAVTYNV